MKEISHHGPGLCVKFYDEFVYAGYGPYIEQYNYKSGELINRCRVFRKNKVHGISISSNGYILAYGARSAAVCSLSDISDNVSILQEERLLAEWITCGEFSADGNKVFLLTCYNKVIISDIIGTIIGVKTIKGERSILYSGSIKPFSDELVYISAGTVMGGVLVWNLYEESIVHNLKGHEGSIFYSTISDNGKYLASCSDDRSIRLWDLKTGAELTIGWGHTARIWNLKFFQDDRKIISVSEDCTCRVWDIIVDEDGKSVLLQQSNIYEVHQIKNVWGVDVNSDHMIAVTSGNDGRLKITDLIQTSRTGKETGSFSIQKIQDELDIPFEKGEIIKGFQWFSFGLIAVTSFGKILKYGDVNKKWTLELEDKRFSSFVIVSGISSKNIAIFMNNKADILLLRFDAVGNLQLSSDYNIKGLKKSTNCLVSIFDRKSIILLLESPNPRDRLIFLKIDNYNLDILQEFRFNRPDNFVTTCMEAFEDYILLGSRFSTIGIFNLKGSDVDPYLIRKLTPGDTITSVSFVEIEKKLPIFSVTNRDGYFNFITIDLKRSSCKRVHFSVLHSNKVSKGFLEGAYIDDKNQYITYGFKSSLFYMYNETNCYEIMSEPCGGAHRQWNLFPDGRGFVLVYIKASDLHYRKIREPRFPAVLKNGLHGREIRDISILKSQPYKNGYLFCTASEDTTVRLSHFDQDTGDITNYWLQRKHVSGLQRCKFINHHLMISCSAREELFLWDIDQDSSSRPYISTRATLPTSSDIPDLRIMDFDVKFLLNSDSFLLATVYSDSVIKVWSFDEATNKFALLIEGRYETCCLLNVKLESVAKQLYLITTPTDGHVVVYNITDYIPYELADNFQFLLENFNECKTLPLPNYITKFLVHQSGIKTFCTDSESLPRTIKIFTGGDDNAIAMNILKVDADSLGIISSSSSFIEDAASSTITSISLFDKNRKLMMTSVDQLVKVWDVTGDDLVPIDKRYTTIADTGSLDVVTLEDSSTLSLIGGVGISLWKLAF
ncbi:hypothetical protein Kpol_1002p74 [Vanderwaltozyma polyspora DSM 70294]|uniref:Uncharacterized protein n=1 Tax=Vanderwaltozyma polyspora (strain ATCC 22028 / DSM 70294 / BCRC 21397 / CBS 2163 / NBRC 10782 / NRRL Y-8283 / UCD 57-17) TaxID=436907 RepID=A7TEA5_VANPO|nr:uncharacterized protein Kpol_1002p74 [Vanderwaltozyma polyspora DSM 70294]EDO19427.1 hypothetical protein Kpol_1002p74 [Vanderwaltozyma polyspora DSM 70294]